MSTERVLIDALLEERTRYDRSENGWKRVKRALGLPPTATVDDIVEKVEALVPKDSPAAAPGPT